MNDVLLSRLDTAEERIFELEDICIETSKLREGKKKEGREKKTGEENGMVYPRMTRQLQNI